MDWMVIGMVMVMSMVMEMEMEMVMVMMASPVSAHHPSPSVLLMMADGATRYICMM